MTTAVTIFYSSATEAELLEYYQSALDFLKHKKITVDIVDVDKTPEKARKEGIVATPYVLIDKDNKKERIFGVVRGIKQFLLNDVQGRSMVHLFSFKEGREQASMVSSTTKKDINEDLSQALAPFDIKDVKIEVYKPKQKKVTVSLRQVEGSDATPIEIEAFLGGFFTEVCEQGTYFVQKKKQKDLLYFESSK